VAIDLRHHRPRPSLERAGVSVGLKLVVLDEVDVARGEEIDQFRRALGAETDAGLDDGADQRACGDAREPGRPGDAELVPGVAVGEGRRQVDVEDAAAGKLLPFKEVADNGRDQVGKQRPEILERPGELDLGPVIDRAYLCPREARGRHVLDLGQALDPRAGSRLQFRGLAGHGDEGAGRLLARHHRNCAA